VYSVDIGGGRRRNIVVVRATTGAVLTAFPFPRKLEPL
jgi:hypothetical protein